MGGGRSQAIEGRRHGKAPGRNERRSREGPPFCGCRPETAGTPAKPGGAGGAARRSASSTAGASFWARGH